MWTVEIVHEISVYISLCFCLCIAPGKLMCSTFKPAVSRPHVSNELCVFTHGGATNGSLSSISAWNECLRGKVNNRLKIEKTSRNE